jgi:hypothetical protein
MNRIEVYAYKVTGDGRALRMKPNPVPWVVGKYGSDEAGKKVRKEFAARGYHIRSLSWRVGGGVVVYVTGTRR